MWENELFALDEEFQTAVVAKNKNDEVIAHAKAIKTQSKLFARRAASEKALADVLPAEIEQGDAWHVLSAGDVDSLSYLAHILKTQNLDYCAFSTWCMAIPDVEQLKKWCETGKIKRLDGYVGEIFPNQYGEEYEELQKVIASTGGRVCVFKNHSKIFLCRSGEKYWVVESSANINTNPRAENAVVTGSKELFLHHKAYFDGIKSFDKNPRFIKIAP